MDQKLEVRITANVKMIGDGLPREWIIKLLKNNAVGIELSKDGSELVYFAKNDSDLAAIFIELDYIYRMVKLHNQKVEKENK